MRRGARLCTHAHTLTRQACVAPDVLPLQARDAEAPHASSPQAEGGGTCLVRVLPRARQQKRAALRLCGAARADARRGSGRRRRVRASCSSHADATTRRARRLKRRRCDRYVCSRARGGSCVLRSALCGAQCQHWPQQPHACKRCQLLFTR
jgi:hypothetical protein